MFDLKDFFEVINSLSVHDLEVLVATLEKEGHVFVLRSMRTCMVSKVEAFNG